VPRDVERLARILTGTGCGLVLGSGGARGMAHIGVLRALAEEGISIDVVGGTSSGSFLGAQVAMGWDYRTILESNRAIVALGRKLVDFTIPMVSFINARRFRQVIDETFGDREIEDLPTKFFCVSCDLTSSDAVVHERGLMRHVIRASCSIPSVFPPVPIDGHLLVDGAVVDALPVGVLKRLLGGGTAIAGDVSQDHFFQGDPAPLEYGGGKLLWHRLTRRGIEYPNLLSILLRAGEVGGSKQRRSSIPLADIYIRPELGRMGMLDHSPERFDLAVEAGYTAARKAIDSWRARQAMRESGDAASA
jgi:NTE family protein